MPLALAGGFFTTDPPGRPRTEALVAPKATDTNQHLSGTSSVSCWLYPQNTYAPFPVWPRETRRVPFGYSPLYTEAREGQSCVGRPSKQVKPSNLVSMPQHLLLLTREIQDSDFPGWANRVPFPEPTLQQDSEMVEDFPISLENHLSCHLYLEGCSEYRVTTSL